MRSVKVSCVVRMFGLSFDFTINLVSRFKSGEGRQLTMRGIFCADVAKKGIDRRRKRTRIKYLSGETSHVLKMQTHAKPHS